MGRKAKVAKAKPDPIGNVKDLATPQNVELMSRAIIATGAGFWAYGQGIVARHSIKPVIQKTISGMDPTNAVLFALCPTAVMLGHLPQYIMDIKATQDKYSRDLSPLYSTLKTYEQLRDAAQLRLDDARKNNYNKGDMAPYEKALAEAQAKVDTQRGLIVSQVEALNDLDEGRAALLVGKVLLAAGLAGWLSCHPEIVKQALSSAEKVTCQLIDESDQIITAGGKAVKDLLPDLWGLGW